MEILRVPAPVWYANAFSKDEAERQLAEEQYNTYRQFYKKLLPTVDALAWTVTILQKHVRRYIFSKDPKGEFTYRVSLFDEKGAVYHVGRDSIDELFQAESFPYDGSELTIIRL